MGSGDQFDSKKFGEDLRQRIHQDIHNRMRGRQVRLDIRTRSSSVLPGIILMVIGTIILLDHIGVVQIGHFWRLWPVILIAVGAVRLVECSNRVFSVLLMLIGTLLLLGNLGFFQLTWNELWPIILIAVGVLMIWGRISMPHWQPAKPGDPNKLIVNTIFGGVERRISTNTFQGGTVGATFGGVELDFRAADIEGDEAVLFVEVLFGGIDIVIPERWMAIYEGQSIFGGYTDETRPPLPEVPGAAPRKRLILRGQAVFGGITVKN